MKRFFCLAGAVLLPCFCHAWVANRTSGGVPRHWELVNPSPLVSPNVVNPTTKAVRYFLAADAFSAGNATAELNALRASFGQWQAITGSHLKFEEGGLLLTGVDINTDDNQNVLFWTKSSTIVAGGTEDIGFALGVTFSSFYADGVMAEADIVFNGFHYDWHTDFTNDATQAQFIEGTALHEIGHMIGIAHSPIGAATMFFVGGDGVDNQVGLSLDEVSAARSIYPVAAEIATRGAVRGQVTKNGLPVFGAAVLLESNGVLSAGTVTRGDGSYLMPALPTGTYSLRVAPLDPSGAFDWLVRGRDITSEYNGADTFFLPTAGTPVTLTAGATNTANVAVTTGSPVFNITYVRVVTANPNSFGWAGLPTSIRPGQSNFTVGVASDNLPTSGATLTITGDGLTLGPVTFNPNAFMTGLNFISTRISVSSNATPGLRSFIVQSGANTAYANGFIEVLPVSADYNFDGLDDIFQRRYFPLFTSSDAGPNADPDGDRFPNASEYVAATVPTNSVSLLKIERVQQNASGATVTWRSVAGKRYQLFGKPQLPGGAWQAIGGAVAGQAGTTSTLDATGTSGTKFYRIQVLP